MREKFICVVLFLLFLTSHADLVQVIQLARHGARAPNSFEYIPNQYPEKNGELTPLGLVQQYFLGQEMRKRYIENQSFLSETLDPSEVIIKSSWKNRTIWSALAFTNGLYPQESGTWFHNPYAETFPTEELLPLRKRQNDVTQEDVKRIRINEEWAREVVDVIKMDGDLYFHAIKDDNCPPAENIINELKKSREILEMEKYLSLSLYPLLASGVNTHLGFDLIKPEKLSIKKVKSILDSYRCNSFHRKSHPEIDENLLKLLKMTRAFYAYKITLVDELVKSISGSKLLAEFLEYTQALINGDAPPKFIFYSAHDTTLEILFSIFLLETKVHFEEQYNIIPFASTLSIEIHREQEYSDDSSDIETKDVYYVKMFYNDEPQLIKWCLGYTCPLEQFHRILQHYIHPNLQNFCTVNKIEDLIECEDESQCNKF